MIKKTGAAFMGASVMGIPAFAQDSNAAGNSQAENKKKKVLIIGAHPDDPESNCGGTMILMQKAGWEVVSVYMTRGEAGIPGKTHAEAAAIRMEEAKNACKVLGARPVFMTQIDGSSEINKARYAEMKELIAAEKPDIVITQWAIDSHPDHRVCSSLVYDAWRRLGYSFELYFSESMTGLQTHLFTPNTYVNISDVAAQKRESVFCHVSQKPEDWVDDWHGTMEKFRGREMGCKAAEAFVHLKRNNSDIL